MPRVGIDLGTTNTLVALAYDDGPHVVPRGSGEALPSVVWYGERSDDVRVGREADNQSECAVRSVKRLMGRTYPEAIEEGADTYFRGSVGLARCSERNLRLEVRSDDGASRLLWPHEVSARILAAARRRAETALGAEVGSAVITVPAYFRDPHRGATLDAAREAGLDVAGGELLDEPSAAALAFAPVVGLRAGEQVLVVDWGGGTFDVTVQSHDGGGWLQRSIDGDLVLGGDDLDHDVLEHVVAQLPVLREIQHDEAVRWALRRAARQTKELLSERERATFTCTVAHPESGAPVAAFREVTRADFESWARPRVRRVAEVVERCLGKPDVDRGSIKKVLLVGGSSRIPAFRQAIQELLPKARLHDEVDPMQAVALGAAIFANQRPEIARICPYGYAFVDDAGECHEVIPPDSPVPTPEYGHYGFRFLTRYAAQTVYRATLRTFVEASGEREYQDRQRLFARGMPPTAAGTPVDVEMWLDEDKNPRLVCHVAGHGKTGRMEGSEYGPRELFTSLDSLTLDAEAKLEANQRGRGLIRTLKDAHAAGVTAAEQEDRAEAERAIRLLEESLEQIEARVQAGDESGVPIDERAARRAREWVPIFERLILPAFRPLLSDQEHGTAVENLRKLRLEAEYGASSNNIFAALAAVKEQLFATAAGPLIKAVHGSHLAGTPDRLGARLRASALRCRDARLAGDEDAARKALAEVQAGLREAEAAIERYAATDAVVDASPDLVIPGKGAVGGH